MSKPGTKVDFARDAAAADAPGEDRRKNERQIATFRTCCLVIDEEAHPAILRNMSDGGAMFEALVVPEPGSLVTYWWDGIEAVEARVAWVQGTRIGVANLSGPAEKIEVPRPRATRVPVHLPVRIWQGGKPHSAELDNISLSGIALHGLRGIEPGTLCTVEIGGETLPNAYVVRTDDGITGIRFERPLAPARLMRMLDGEDSAVLLRSSPCASLAGPSKAAAAKAGAQETHAPQGERPFAKPAAPVRRFL